MTKTKHGGVLFFQDPDFDPEGFAIHGFFTRRGGVSKPPFDSLNVGWNSGDTPEAIQENLERIALALAIPTGSIFRLRQVHGTHVVSVRTIPAAHRPLPPEHWPEGDALLTGEKGVALALSTADCLPVFLLDPAWLAVGAVHAGWRGSVEKICPVAIRRMNLDFGTDPSRLRVLMGPAVGPCCYPVGPEVAHRAALAAPRPDLFLMPRSEGGWVLDLRKLNECQILSCGVPPENIRHVQVCTSCRPDLFFSVRRDGELTGRQIALIGLKPGGAHKVLKKNLWTADGKKEETRASEEPRA